MLKIYDGLFVFESTNSEEALEPLMGRVRSEIVRLEGEIIADDLLGKRPFARPMHKRDHGIYSRLRFQIDPAQIQVLHKRWRLVEGLIRAQVLAVDPAREAILAEQAARQAAHAAENSNSDDDMRR